MNIVIPRSEFFYHCPFSGSCNTCGALPDGGINTCPSWDEDLDDIAAPRNCPLLTEGVTVKLEGA